ncbi:DNA-directed RNA polymerase subunit omega [Thalassorhabdus alkalitolerans]|uniref:DNA-directed RNA polymerase subunit omega n=1 Tax=Thalassorhabdus alkalitolerans TaxID=2282697 RepID=A0ABW0YIG4_9BACI|nr:MULTISPECIES: DNA-directed RNA polymerase subunit omega [Bacillaceae]
MLYPSIDSLLKQIDSKYTLVTLSARRARDLLEMDEMTPLVEDYESSKYVGIALEEIKHGELGLKKE